MPIVDSRLGPGTLTLGGTDYGVQVSNVKLTPSTDITDGTKTLGVSDPDPVVADPKWELSGTAIQDFDDDGGFVEFCRANAGDSVAFSWVPNATGPSYAGNCTVIAVEIGGDVGTQITTDFTFPVTGQPTVTY